MSEELQDKNKKDTDKKNNVHAGHRERMRKKFLKSGFDSFETHEILEMILFFAIPRANTNEIAHNLLDKYGSLSCICDVDIDELQKIKGIGAHCALLLKMIPFITQEYFKSKKNRFEDLSTGRAACEYFKNQFYGVCNEQIRIVCLNENRKALTNQSDLIAEGVPGKVSVNIRRIIEITYKNHSENIMIAHNHPNGIATPSDEDIKSTIKLYNTLKSIGIHLCDHILIANNTAVSFKDSAVFNFN